MIFGYFFGGSMQIFQELFLNHLKLIKYYSYKSSFKIDEF